MEGTMAPQTFIYGCVLEAGKEVTFDPSDDDFEHQLDLRMACVDINTKSELHMVEVEGQDAEGKKVKAVIASLNPSTLPSVCLSGFTITPPAVFRLKAGSGPINICGQHLVMMDADQSFDEDDDDEDDEEEEMEDVKPSKKRPAPSPARKSEKKIKMDMDEEEEDDDDDDDDDDDEEDDEDDDSPVKPQPKATKKTAAVQNGKGSKPSTPAGKQAGKGKDKKSPKTPPTPKAVLTLPEIKTKIMEAVKKGVSLPKVQAKFENFVKNGYKVSDAKDVVELWQWRQTMKEAK